MSPPRPESPASRLGPRRRTIASPEDEALPAPPAEDDDSPYRFKAGQRVNVLRSNGSWSEGTVVLGFEGVFEPLYQIRFDNGQCKQAVPEDELSETLDHYYATLMASESLDVDYDMLRPCVDECLYE